MENTKEEKYIGINERLYNIRIEKGLSLRKAAKLMCISSRLLFLLEHGYVQISPLHELMFSHFYNLENDFFTKDELKYPTIVDAERPEPEADENTQKSISFKIYKFLGSILFKIILGVGIAASATFLVIGLCNLPRIYNDTLSFYDKDIVSLRNDAIENGIKHDCDFSSYVISECIYDDFYSFSTTYGDDKCSLESSINFFSLSENIPYTFFSFDGYIYNEIIESDLIVQVEMRNDNNSTKIHFYFDDLDILGVPITYHISAILNTNNTFTYLSVDYQYSLQLQTQLNKEDPTYEYVTSYFEKCVNSYITNAYLSVFSNVIVPRYPELTVNNFSTKFVNNTGNLHDFDSKNTNRVISGTITSIILLAFLLFSFIVSYEIKNYFKNLSLSKSFERSSNNSDVVDKAAKEKPVHSLKPNNYVSPFIPEWFIKVCCLLITLASSVLLVSLFSVVIDINLTEIVNKAEEISSFSILITISMMLLFFMNIDIQSQKTRNLSICIILFFGGLMYYILMVILSSNLNVSKGAMQYTINQILTLLPGNIIWGVLAFRLLTTFLFSTPKGIENNKLKAIGYRSLSILPIIYLFSGVIQNAVQNQTNIPFTVKSLFFSKGFVLTAFAVIFCLSVFIYQLILKYKYGKENYEIYKNGNKYYYTRNIIACSIILLLAIIDITVGKLVPNNVLSLGNNFPIIFTIPFIFFYHPHMGKRSFLWDVLFQVSFIASLTCGALIIGNYIIQMLSTI